MTAGGELGPESKQSSREDVQDAVRSVERQKPAEEVRAEDQLERERPRVVGDADSEGVGLGRHVVAVDGPELGSVSYPATQRPRETLNATRPCFAVRRHAK